MKFIAVALMALVASTSAIQLKSTPDWTGTDPDTVERAEIASKDGDQITVYK